MSSTSIEIMTSSSTTSTRSPSVEWLDPLAEVAIALPYLARDRRRLPERKRGAHHGIDKPVLDSRCRPTPGPVGLVCPQHTRNPVGRVGMNAPCGARRPHAT